MSGETLEGWDKIQEIMDLIIEKKAKFTSNNGLTEKTGNKTYYRKHLLIARLIIKDLKRVWAVEGLKGAMTFKQYYRHRKSKG